MKLNPICRSLIENTNDIILITDTNPFDQGGPRIVYVNSAFEKLMGYTKDEVMGKSPRILNGTDTDRQTLYRIRKALREAKGIRVEILKYNKQGRERWLDINIVPLTNAEDEVTHFASIERDMTRYKKRERQLVNMALFDSLTGALSRPAFFQHAEKEFGRSQRYNRPLSVMMIDIDHFKKVNDEYGHQAGDNVLQIFSEAMQEEIRSTDFIGRIGGEEFTLLLPDTTLKEASYLAERVRARITKYPYLAGDMLIEVTASLGVAELHKEDKDFNELLQRADEAMYQAKQGGRNQVITSPLSLVS